MKSTTGEHFVGLDHVRALAAFLVICWHFNHGAFGFPIPFGAAPAMPPFAIIDQGHTGVALFMCLSGYLFAKLLDGKQIHFPSFLWNRALRLLPLLIVVIVLHALLAFLAGEGTRAYWTGIVEGVVLPTLPSGGWSITTEFHFYLVLPLLLWFARRSKALPVLIVVAALCARAVVYFGTGEVWSYAYWTIVGRIDQFTMGIVLFHYRGALRGRHAVAMGLVATTALVFYVIDVNDKVAMAHSSPLWIYLATIEAILYSTLIAWYDTSFEIRNVGVARVIGLVGSYSYSIYLFHFFFYERAMGFVHRHLMPLTNIYAATAGALLFLIGMTAVGHVSFQVIEKPFLRYRRRYTVSRPVDDVRTGAAVA